MEKKPVETRQNRERAKGMEAGKKLLEGGDDKGTPSDVWDRAKEDKGAHLLVGTFFCLFSALFVSRPV